MIGTRASWLTMFIIAVGVTTSHTASADPGFGHGHHGHGRGGVSIDRLLAQAAEKLNLDSSQQQQLNIARQQSKFAREQMRANTQRLKQKVDAELARSEPDLAAIAAVADEAQGLNRQLRSEARNEWLRLYSILSSSQKMMVGDML